MVSPIENGANRALKPVRDLVGWLGDTFDAKGENEKLRDEVGRPARGARRPGDRAAATPTSCAAWSGSAAATASRRGPTPWPRA